MAEKGTGTFSGGPCRKPVPDRFPDDDRHFSETNIRVWCITVPNKHVGSMEPDEGAERSLNFPFSRTKSPQSRSSRAGLVLALILYWAEAAIQVIISTAKKSDFLFDLRGGQNAWVQQCWAKRSAKFVSGR
jgi:hypothetical protein